MKIDTLTTEQENQLVIFREEWLKIGLSTDPANRPKAEKAITEMYQLIDCPVPYFWWVDSPIMANIVLNVLHENSLGHDLSDNLRANLGDNLGANLWDNLWDNLGDNLWDNLGDSLRDKSLNYYNTSLWGSVDAYWVAYYLFPHQHLKTRYADEDLKLLNLWASVSQSCFWWWPYSNVCFISDRPESIHKDNENRLHNEKGKSVSFRDGWGISTWHGISVPDIWITDKNSITPEIALKWENIEQRRCACEIVGWANILSQLNPKMIDKDQDPMVGELIEVDLPESGKERFLKVLCGTGRIFALPVPPDMKTALQANAWSYGLEPHQLHPEVRT